MRNIMRLAAVPAALLALSGTALAVAQPAAAATECKSVYTTRPHGGMTGSTTLKVCHNGFFVKTLHVEVHNTTNRAVYGPMRIADNANHAWDSSRTRLEPDQTLGVHFTVDENWPNGRRVCAVFKMDGTMPGPQGHACIKIDRGRFVDDTRR